LFFSEPVVFSFRELIVWPFTELIQFFSKPLVLYYSEPVVWSFSELGLLMSFFGASVSLLVFQ
jgi:hypothetical protein